jgi:hypothetical protein
MWLLWRLEANADPAKKPLKMPYYADGGRRKGELDSPADRARLVTYAEAAAALQRAAPGTFTGLGHALGQDGRGGFWQGIDLDDIAAAGTADIADLWTRGECAGLGYAEMSPSGTGLHLVGYGRHFRSLGSNASGIEAYAGTRFFTFTGRPIVANSPCAIHDLAEYVETELARRHGAARVQAAGDTGVVRVDAQTVTDLRCALAHMRSDDRALWVAIGHALKPLGDTGRGLWIQWSQTSEKYDAREAERAWESFAPRNTRYQAVFAEATRQGWINPRQAERIAHGAWVAERFLKQLPTPSRAEQPVGAPRYLRLLLDGDLDTLPRLRWLVKGVIPDAGIGAIYGASGTFKSFLTLDLLAHVSNGREWFGHRVKAAPAVYVPFEGQGGIPNRVRAWRLAQTAARHPDRLATFEPDADVASRVAVVMEPLNLREQAHRDHLVATLKDCGWAGGVLCIDTLAHASAGIEENSSAMGEMIAIFRDLQQQLGGVILLVHHSGKDESRGMRGWSGLHAAMDFVVECHKEGEADAREAQFRLSKVKDGTTGTAFNFRMQLVQLGFDEDGDAITSLTVCPVEPGEKPEHPFVEDALKEAADDDDFVQAWVRELENLQPTRRYLESARPLVKERRSLTQKRLRDAICRLMAAGRLEDVHDSVAKNLKWLRAVDVPQLAG